MKKPIAPMVVLSGGMLLTIAIGALIGFAVGAWWLAHNISWR